MISYRITSKSTSHTSIPTAPIDKHEKIFRRAISKASKNYQPGQQVLFVGTQRKAVVLEVLTDIKRVHWKGDKPFYIKIKFDDHEQTVLCHSSSLRKTNT